MARRFRIALLLFAGLAASAVALQTPAPAENGNAATAKAKALEVKADAKALNAVGLKPDDAEGLLKYLRQRTLTESDAAKINDVMKRMSNDDFEVRLKASKDMLAFGSAAVGPLRKAAWIDPNNVNAANFELAHRASEVLKAIEKVPYASVSAAVVRACGKFPTAETNRALLGFLPAADGPTVAAEIRKVLIAQAIRDGKVEPALLAALKDPVPVRRRAAAEALIRGGNDTARIRIPEAYPLVRAAAKVETDPDTKFAMSFLAATVSRDTEAIEELLESLPRLKRGHLWQLEDLLLQLAGETPPKAVLGVGVESLKTAQAAWQGWWKRNRDGLKLDDFAYRPRTLGTMLVVMSDFRLATGIVAELGPDMTDLWRIGNLQSLPADAAMLPDGRLIIAEMHNSIISFRNTDGTILSSKSIVGDPARGVSGGSPQQLQVLSNGSILAVCRNQVTLLKPDESQSVVYARGMTFDISTAAVLPNGETAVMLQNGPNHFVFLDKDNKEIAGRNVKIVQPWYQAYLTATADGRVLFTEQNQVVEYDVAKAEVVWKKASLQPRCVQRLYNGHTLIVEGTMPGNYRIVEVDSSGVEVWTHTLPVGFYIHRAYRR